MCAILLCAGKAGRVKLREGRGDVDKVVVGCYIIWCFARQHPSTALSDRKSLRHWTILRFVHVIPIILQPRKPGCSSGGFRDMLSRILFLFETKRAVLLDWEMRLFSHKRRSICAWFIASNTRMKKYITWTSIARMKRLQLQETPYIQLSGERKQVLKEEDIDARHCLVCS